MIVVWKFTLLYILILCINKSRSEYIKEFDEIWKLFEKNKQLFHEKVPIRKREISFDVQEPKNWDCPQNETIQRSELTKTLDMLEKGEKEVNKYQNSSRTILVLGDAGVGKTTFVQFMAENNSHLIAKETNSDTNEFIIEDGNKISRSPVDSFTLYPEKVLQNTEITFSDTPGFSDTRSTKHEVVATYVLKKYLEHFTDLKIVLLINYNSVQQGVYKADFTRLLENVNSFIRDIDKYRNNIVLIATKVPNSYKYQNKYGNFTLIKDQSIINSIAEFIYIVKSELQLKLQNTENNIKEEILLLENMIKIAESLIEKDQNGLFKKINIFRRPSEGGSLSSMELFQESKTSLQNTVTNKTDYVALTKNDIGYSLSGKAKFYLECLLRYTDNKISKVSSSMFNEIQKYYEDYIDNKNYSSISKLNVELKVLINQLENLKDNLEEMASFDAYISHIKNFINLKSISLPDVNSIENEIEEIKILLEKLNYFDELNTHRSSLIWTAEMKPLLNFIKDSRSWYTFLENLFNNLSAYNVQKTKLRFFNVTQILKDNENSHSTNILIPFLQMISSRLDYITDKSMNEFFQSVTLNKKKIAEVEEVLTLSLQENTNITCLNEGKLIVSGVFVRLGEISSNEMVRYYCGNNNTLKTLIIYGVGLVFIDADLNDDVFKGVNVMIAAPNWKIIGNRKIVLDGNDGEPLKGNVLDTNVSSASGSDGLPGTPGTNGGNLVGIGVHFENGETLTITSNGGSGSAGKNGGVGVAGSNGIDGCKLLLTKQNLTPDKKYLTNSWYTGFTNLNSALIGDTHIHLDTHLADLPRGLQYNRPWITKTDRWDGAFVNYESSPQYFQGIEYNSESNIDDVKYIQEHFNDYNFFELDICGGKIDIYERDGAEGGRGGSGGNGGVGGYGGNPGNIHFMEMLEKSKIHTLQKVGSRGIPGRGGFGGKGGAKGKSVLCYNSLLHNVNNDYEFSLWRCTNTTKYSSEENKKNGKDGMSGVNEKGIIRPLPSVAYNYSTDILNYIVIVSEYVSNKFVSENVVYFKNELLKRELESLNSNFWNKSKLTQHEIN